LLDKTNGKDSENATKNVALGIGNLMNAAFARYFGSSSLVAHNLVVTTPVMFSFVDLIKDPIVVSYLESELNPTT